MNKGTIHDSRFPFPVKSIKEESKINFKDEKRKRMKKRNLKTVYSLKFTVYSNFY